jgi:hypothetical protein
LKNLKRRDFLRILALGIIGVRFSPEVLAQSLQIPLPSFSEDIDHYIKDYLHKMEHFNRSHKDDIRVSTSDYATFRSTVKRLRRLQQFIGYGNFQILSIDEGLGLARKYPEVGNFTRKELEFLEKIFYSEALEYGFFGQKPLDQITFRIKDNEVIKVPNSGNFLFKELAHETFMKIKQQLGDKVVLTSGVRGVMKQFLLFMDKAYKNRGNLSLASRSLAPPGYSFHGIGDFDVGQTGLGADNFTQRFTATDVYKRLCDLGYLTLRYPEKNLLGVRFEPWHIKINTS